MARTPSLFGFTVLFALVAVLLLLAPSAANAAQQQVCPQSDVRPDAWVQVPPHPTLTSALTFLAPIAQTFGYAQALVKAMNDLNFSSEKMALLQKSVANDTRVFSGAQIVNILQALPFTDDKVQVPEDLFLLRKPTNH